MRTRSWVALAWLAATILVFPQSGSAQGSGPWIQNPANGHLYRLTSEPLSWTAAEAEAISLGGHLASIDSQAEQAWLTSTFDPAGVEVLWIGFNDATTEGIWRWSDGSPATFANWGGSEPNDYLDEDHAVMQTMSTGSGCCGGPGRWVDIWENGHGSGGNWPHGETGSHPNDVYQYGIIEYAGSVGGSGGPVVLMGIDAEDGGPGGHGPITVYSDVLTAFLGSVSNGGSGVLVIGGGKQPNDDVTSFWQALAAQASVSITFVNGPTNIQSQPFGGFAMLAVVSDVTNTPSGGLTQAENDTLSARRSDVASFVNSGGGLLGFSSTGFTAPYGYLGELGSFQVETGLGYSDITPTPQGSAVGLTDALDVCCWHDRYVAFPSYLDVLAIDPSSQRAAAVGGNQVVIACPGSLLVYRNDFERYLGREWSAARSSTTPIGNRRFLGEFGSEDVVLEIPDLPGHSQVALSFDLLIIRSWDGNSVTDPGGGIVGPDRWGLEVVGGPLLIDTTFATHTPRTQAFPDPYPQGNHPIDTGAAEVDTLGYDNHGDAVYRISIAFPHTSAKLRLRFWGTTVVPDILDESWGLDNVEVCVRSDVELLVTSWHGDEVLRFEPFTGSALGTFASGGGLDGPLGLAIGPDQHLYVSRHFGDEVLRFDGSTGTFLDAFVAQGSSPLGEPVDLEFARDGNLYVVSAQTDSVLRYDGITGAFLGAFVTTGSGGLDSPGAMEFGPGGDLYVANISDSTVLRYDGTSGASLGTFASGPDPTAGFYGLLFDSDFLYVTAAHTDEVVRFDALTGAWAGVLVPSGSGGITCPHDLFVHAGRLHVLAHCGGSNKIASYAPQTGAYLGDLVPPGAGGLNGPQYAILRKR